MPRMPIVVRDRIRRAGTLFRRQSIAIVLAAAVSGLSAGRAVAELDPYPLRPPNTSSPRETFRSFVSRAQYRRYEIDYPEIAFENREDPRVHRYRTARPPRTVSIYGRKR